MILNQRHILKLFGILTLLVAPLLFAGNAQAVRVKDIASFSGVRVNQLVGYGLVVGLGGTGDRRGSEFTLISMSNMLEKMGVKIDLKSLRPANAAAVMVTAQMPASARPGSKLDVTVSSVGDAKSLLGGVLLMTPLRGIDGEIYGVAQGPLAVGGIDASGAAATAKKNVTTVATVPGGATIERNVPFEFDGQREMVLNMKGDDFSTVMEVSQKINGVLGGNYSRAVDASTIRLSVPPAYQGNIVPMMAKLENIQIDPDLRARVVVDEKTGTIVIGSNTKLSPVAVTHGSMQIVVQESAEVVQPMPFSRGETVTVPQTNINVNEENRRLKLVAGATLQELVEGLNALGATPRDLISILKTLKSAGSLHADLEVI